MKHASLISAIKRGDVIAVRKELDRGVIFTKKARRDGLPCSTRHIRVDCILCNS